MSKVIWKGKEFLQKLYVAENRALSQIGEKVTEDAKYACPIDTGRLRDSIRNNVNFDDTDNPKVQIGSDLKYSTFVELGTRNQSPQPFLRNSLANNYDNILRLLKNLL